jgi:hypothetical protein
MKPRSMYCIGFGGCLTALRRLALNDSRRLVDKTPISGAAYPVSRPVYSKRAASPYGVTLCLELQVFKSSSQRKIVAEPITHQPR